MHLGSAARLDRPLPVAVGRTPMSWSSPTPRSPSVGAETDYAETLAELLDRQPWAGHAEVVGWRFSLSTGWSLQAGLKDDQLGGPYEPPATARGTSGRGYLRWSDGCVSHIGLDTRT